jgi:hypothetical protein
MWHLVQTLTDKSIFGTKVFGQQKMSGVLYRSRNVTP